MIRAHQQLGRELRHRRGLGGVARVRRGEGEVGGAARLEESRVQLVPETDPASGGVQRAAKAKAEAQEPQHHVRRGRGATEHVRFRNTSGAT